MTRITDQRPIILATHLTAKDSGGLPEILDLKNIPYVTLRLNKNDELPRDISNYRGIVLFGGIQSTNDDYIDYIYKELNWIDNAVNKEFPIFGICLGAQLVARALGAKVLKNRSGLYEFGWYPVEPSEANPLAISEFSTFYQRHGEIFELPEGAKLAATNTTCKNQAFIYGNSVIATQFHPEINNSLLSSWLNKPRPLQDEKYYGAQDVEKQIKESALYIPPALAWLETTIDIWLT